METLLSTPWKRKRGDGGPTDASLLPSAAACAVQLGGKITAPGREGRGLESTGRRVHGTLDCVAVSHLSLKLESG